MHKKSITMTMLIILSSAFIFGLGFNPDISAQTPCGEQVGVTEYDSTCGYLDDELLAYDLFTNYPGILLNVEGDPNTDRKLRIGLDTTLIRNRTWGGGSDFIWTFDGSGTASGHDPSFEFGDCLTKHNGQFEVKINTDGTIDNISNFRSKTPTVTGGSVDNACGIYIDQIKGENISNSFGIYQAGTDDYNFMGGRLAIGADVDGYPTNTVIYLDKHYDNANDTYYGGYLEVRQTASLNHPTEDRFPATLECIYKYDTTENTIWVPGRDIRAKVIDGSFMVVNSGRINYAAGVNGGVDVTPEYYPIPAQVYPGADTAVGVRGGIAIASNVPVPEYNDPEDYNLEYANINNAAGITTAIDIKGGQVNRLSCILAHVPGIVDGQIGELTGIGIQPLTPKYATDAVIWRKYGIRQEGSEENLLNGYMTIDSKIGHDYDYDYDDNNPDDEPLIFENFINIGAKSIFKLSFDPVNISDKLIGFKYSTPVIENPVCTLSVENSYCMYLETSKIDGVSNSWGIYQEGNDPNYFNGYIGVNTQIDSKITDDNIASYKATSTLNSETDAINYYGFKYETPTASGTPEIANMYGIYLEQIAPNPAPLNVETYGIYQAGSEKNFLKGPVTIDQTEKVRAYRVTSAQTFAMPGWNKVSLNGESYDNLGHFDSESQYPTYQFTASMDGYYQVNANVCFTGTNDTDQIGIAIYKNGAQYSISYGRGFANNIISLNISDIIPLNEDETIQLWVYITRTGISIMPSTSGTYLSIHKIS